MLKLLCQPNYQDGCALAGLTDQDSPGGIGGDRPSEKRKVGSSTLPLTTILMRLEQPSDLRLQQEERDSHGAVSAYR